MQGYFRKRGDKWSFTIDIGRDPVTNKRKQKTVSGFRTRKEAEKACAEMLTEIERGNFVNTSNKDTYGEFLLDFIDSHVKLTVARNTYDNQLALAKNHIIPVLGHIKLVKLTPLDIQQFYKLMKDKGFSGGHIQNVGNLITKSIRTAAEWGMILKDVASVVKKPSAKQENQMKVWTIEESQTFLELSNGSKFHLVYMIAITTGMRKGEILGLQWKNIDFSNKSITVQNNLVYAGNELKLTSPKTAASKRTITVPDFLIKYLKEYKLKQTPNTLDLVVTGVKNEMLYHNVLDQQFAKDVKSAGLPKIRFHDMRHTHATILLQMGENPKVVMERLGHSNVSVTLNTYSHVLPGMQKNVAEKLNNAFNF